MALEVQTQQPQSQPLEQDHVCGGSHEPPHHHGVVLLTGPSSNLREPIPITLDLFHTTNPSSSDTQLEPPSPPPFGCQKFFKYLKTGEIFNRKIVKKRCSEDTKMSRRNGPKLDLKLNLSPPRANGQVESPRRSATVSPTSPQSSCVSSELNQDETLQYSTNSPEATSMLLVGCPRCLMYVMLAEEDPRCPKCKSTVLLDVLRQNTTTAAAATTTTTRKS